MIQRCYVRIDNYEVCEEKGDTKQEARENATTRAVEILRENCYTIRYRLWTPVLHAGFSKQFRNPTQFRLQFSFRLKIRR